MSFEVRPDPRVSVKTEDFQSQFRFLLAARDKLTEAHRAIKQVRDVREQLSNLTKRLKDKAEHRDVLDAAQALDRKITAVEEALHQTKARSSQDVLNYPIRLNNRLTSLAGMVSAGDNRPTDQSVQVKDELTAQIDVELVKLRDVLAKDLAGFNELLARKKVPGIFADPGK